MMIALYSVGNVKRELKKIGRKLYIRDFAKFIFAYIEEDKLSLLTVQKITDDRWQIIHFYAEKIQKNNEDINFYQEILYRFYKEQERENIKYLVINFAEQKQQILHYSFPRMYAFVGNKKSLVLGVTGRYKVRGVLLYIYIKR